MATHPVKRNTGQEVQAIIVPEFGAGVEIDDPFSIGFVDQHRAVKHPAPGRHRAIKVRVRKGDRIDTTQGPDDFYRGDIEKADAVPKNIALGRDDQKRPLPDSELWGSPDAKQARRYFSESIEATSREFFGRDPLLARFGNELTVILADYAVFGRCLIVRILKATGLAQKFWHDIVLKLQIKPT
jgi:hypothetical protein